jgi:hypothetical protein
MTQAIFDRSTEKKLLLRRRLGTAFAFAWTERTAVLFMTAAREDK